jgi:hypothetical protein
VQHPFLSFIPFTLHSGAQELIVAHMLACASQQRWTRGQEEI